MFNLNQGPSNSLFGNTPQQTTAGASLFGTTGAGGLFGASTTTTNTQQPLNFMNQPAGIGAGVQNSQSNPLFGGNQQNKPTGFLGAPTQTPMPTGLLGQQTTNTMQQNNVFGQNMLGGQSQNIMGQSQTQNPMGNQGQNTLGQQNLGINPTGQGLFNQTPKTTNQTTPNQPGS